MNAVSNRWAEGNFGCSKCDRSFETNRGLETHFGMAHPTEKTKMEREEREKDREAATKMALAFSANFSQLTDGLAQVTDGLREQNQQLPAV